MPSGTIGPGAVQLSLAGGADLGLFQSAVSFPREITILERFQPGDQINVSNPSPDEPIAIHWNNGAADTIVEWTLMRNNSDVLTVVVPGDQGVATISPFRTSQGKVLWEYPGVLPGPGFALRVRVRPANPSMIDMPGMGQPIAQDWVIEFRFEGLVGV